MPAKAIWRKFWAARSLALLALPVGWPSILQRKTRQTIYLIVIDCRQLAVEDQLEGKAISASSTTLRRPGQKTPVLADGALENWLRKRSIVMPS